MYQLTTDLPGLKMWITKIQYDNLAAHYKQYYVDYTRYYVEERGEAELVEED